MAGVGCTNALHICGAACPPYNVARAASLVILAMSILSAAVLSVCLGGGGNGHRDDKPGDLAEPSGHNSEPQPPVYSYDHLEHARPGAHPHNGEIYVPKDYSSSLEATCKGLFTCSSSDAESGGCLDDAQGESYKNLLVFIPPDNANIEGKRKADTVRAMIYSTLASGKFSRNSQVIFILDQLTTERGSHIIAGPKPIRVFSSYAACMMAENNGRADFISDILPLASPDSISNGTFVNSVTPSSMLMHWYGLANFLPKKTSNSGLTGGANNLDIIMKYYRANHEKPYPGIAGSTYLGELDRPSYGIGTDSVALIFGDNDSYARLLDDRMLKLTLGRGGYPPNLTSFSYTRANISNGYGGRGLKIDLVTDEFTDSGSVSPFCPSVKYDNSTAVKHYEYDISPLMYGAYDLTGLRPSMKLPAPNSFTDDSMNTICTHYDGNSACKFSSDKSSVTIYPYSLYKFARGWCTSVSSVNSVIASLMSTNVGPAKVIIVQSISTANKKLYGNHDIAILDPKESAFLLMPDILGCPSLLPLSGHTHSVEIVDGRYVSVNSLPYYNFVDNAIVRSCAHDRVCLDKGQGCIQVGSTSLEEEYNKQMSSINNKQYEGIGVEPCDNTFLNLYLNNDKDSRFNLDNVIKNYAVAITKHLRGACTKYEIHPKYRPGPYPYTSDLNPNVNRMVIDTGSLYKGVTCIHPDTKSPPRPVDSGSCALALKSASKYLDNVYLWRSQRSS